MKLPESRFDPCTHVEFMNVHDKVSLIITDFGRGLYFYRLSIGGSYYRERLGDINMFSELGANPRATDINDVIISFARRFATSICSVTKTSHESVHIVPSTKEALYFDRKTQ